MDIIGEMIRRVASNVDSRKPPFWGFSVLISALAVAKLHLSRRVAPPA
jgi:hypothetical protein